MFEGVEQQLMPMNLSEARRQGYEFDLTDGRLVFRTMYGQPDSLSTEVNVQLYLCSIYTCCTHHCVKS